jgi:hypothetical protein
MTVYINGMACISHYNTSDTEYFFENVTAVPVNCRLTASEPDYSKYIPGGALRRMSHIIKMGVSTALISMNAAGIEKVDAIITGTGMGCVDDTDIFLGALLNNNEELLAPTSFIRSTHNTVSGQIALFIKCTGYNCNYVHQNCSFEYALQDAIMLLEEEESKTVLIGGIDETTPTLFEIFRKSGNVKNPEEMYPVWSTNGKGYIIGEGSAFFNLSASPNSSISPKILAVKCLQPFSDTSDLMHVVETFLESAGLNITGISLVLAGNCGDREMDTNISAFNNRVNLPVAYFKHLCGEYFTSSAFAVWLAAKIITKQHVPQAILPNHVCIPAINQILIVNHYRNQQYSLICISA